MLHCRPDDDWGVDGKRDCMHHELAAALRHCHDALYQGQGHAGACDHGERGGWGHDEDSSWKEQARGGPDERNSDSPEPDDVVQWSQLDAVNIARDFFVPGMKGSKRLFEDYGANRYAVDTGIA